MIYKQVSGEWWGPDQALWGKGYSGKDSDKNNPASQGKLAEGPIPEGHYTIVGPPLNTAEHGPYVLRLIPDEKTKAFIVSLGRDPLSFLLHGDSIPHPGGASEGCIIQQRAVRERVWAANDVDAVLEVVSGYDEDITV